MIIRAKLIKLWARVHVPSMHELVHKGEHFCHMTYLGLVSVEVKYWYGKAAAVMLVLTVVSLFIGEGESE